MHLERERVDMSQTWALPMGRAALADHQATKQNKMTFLRCGRQRGVGERGRAAGFRQTWVLTLTQLLTGWVTSHVA